MEVQDQWNPEKPACAKNYQRMGKRPVRMDHVVSISKGEPETQEKSADAIGNREQLHRRVLRHLCRGAFIVRQNFEIFGSVAKTVDLYAVDRVRTQSPMRRRHDFDLDTGRAEGFHGFSQPGNFIVRLEPRIDGPDNQDLHGATPETFAAEASMYAG